MFINETIIKLIYICMYNCDIKSNIYQKLFTTISWKRMELYTEKFIINKTVVCSL